jgi:hypothetical protein
MSYREKSAWACLVTTLAVFVPYFAHVFTLSARADVEIAAIASALIAAVILQTLVNVVSHMLFAIRSRAEQKDERDVAIESRSFRNAYFVLATSGCLLILAAMLWARALTLASVTQLLLLCFVGGEVTKYLTRAVCYRRGA